MHAQTPIAHMSGAMSTHMNGAASACDMAMLPVILMQVEPQMSMMLVAMLVQVSLLYPCLLDIIN